MHLKGFNLPASIQETNFSRLFSSDIFDNLTKPIMQNRYGLSVLHAFGATAFIVACSFLWSRDKTIAKQDKHKPEPKAPTAEELEQERLAAEEKARQEEERVRREEELKKRQMEDAERKRKAEEDEKARKEEERRRIDEEARKYAAEMEAREKYWDASNRFNTLLISKEYSKQISLELIWKCLFIAKTNAEDARFDFKLRDVLLRFAQFDIGNKELANQLIDTFYTPFKKNGAGLYKISEYDNPTTEEKVNRRMLASLLYNTSMEGLLTIACLNDDVLKATGLSEDTIAKLMLFKEYYGLLLPTAIVQDYTVEQYIAWIRENRSEIELQVRKEEAQQALLDIVYEACIKSGNFYMAIAKLNPLDLKEEFSDFKVAYGMLFERFVKENPDRDDALLYTPDESGKMPIRALFENFVNVDLYGQKNIVLSILTQFNDSAKDKDENGVSVAMKRAVQLSDKDMPEDMPDVKEKSVDDVSAKTLLELAISCELEYDYVGNDIKTYLLKYDPMLRVQTVKDMVGRSMFEVKYNARTSFAALVLNGRWGQVRGNKDYLLHRIVREFDLGISKIRAGICEALEYLALKGGYDVLQKDENAKVVADYTKTKPIIESLERILKEQSDRMERDFTSLLICTDFDNPDINRLLSSLISDNYITEDERKKVETALNSGAIPANDNNNPYLTRCYEALKPHFKQTQNEQQSDVSK